jgi:hypothetical protein
MSEKNFVQNFKANFFEYTNEKCTGQTKGQKVFLYKKKCIPNYHIGTSIAMQLLVLKKMLLRLTKFVSPPPKIIIDNKIQFWFQDKPPITIISTKTEVSKKGILYFNSTFSPES